MVFALVVIATVLAAGVVPGGGSKTRGLLLYEVTLAGIAVALGGATVARRGAVLDLVVELAEPSHQQRRDDLARALGDPSLVVGYWSSTARDYLTAEVTAVPHDHPSEGRAVTYVGPASAPVAVFGDTATVEEGRLIRTREEVGAGPFAG